MNVKDFDRRVGWCDFRVVLLGFLLLMVTSCASATNRKPYIDPNTNIIIKVPEDAAVGTSLLNMTAIDQENDPVTFGLDDAGELLLNIRNISPRQGELTLKTQLNRESVKRYEFSVTVTDGGDDRKTPKQFYLDVDDVNDNKPVFVQQPYWISISENTTVGTTLLTIQATDADLGSNAVVRYRFSNNSNSAQTSKFSIDNLLGTITLASSLDYETTSRYLLPVVAEDTGNPKLESQTTVVIDVTDISDNPPKFERSVYLKEIDENTPVGTSILAVIARDGDTGINSPMKYEIYSGNDGTFTINSSTGVITVNSTIDAEKTQTYKFYVRASEVPDPSSNATVSVLITVIDKNDNPPVFSQDSYSFTLREDLAKPGRILTDQLIVTDADKNPEFRRLTYHVTGRDSNKFIIDSSSGILKINSILDYETQVNYTLTIVVKETETTKKYSDNATVHLTLINDNDNKPVFANPSYHYTFDEEIPPGKEIAVVTQLFGKLPELGIKVGGTLKCDVATEHLFVTMATDADLGSFGQITYDLRGDQSSFFAVDSNTGNITAAKTLDYDQVQSYQFYLIASDGGGIYKQQDNAVINVTLRDINDNEPVFTGTPYTSDKDSTSILTENSKGDTFSAVTSLSIVVGLLVMIIVIILAFFICHVRRIKRDSKKSSFSTKPFDKETAVDQGTFQMQNTPFLSDTSLADVQTTSSINPRRGSSSEVIVNKNLPNTTGTANNDEPQYADLNSSTSSPSTFYQELSPSTRNRPQDQSDEKTLSNAAGDSSTPIQQEI